MIDINFSPKSDNLNGNINENSILIIGPADSEYLNSKIVYPQNLNDVEESFGVDSELTKAYIEAKEVGATDVFLCNCFKFTDYIEIIDLISQSHFPFIVPLFDFSLTFMNPLNNKETYLSEIFCEFLEYSNSTVILTEKHASLFENLDHYLIAMKAINYKFKEKSLERLIAGEKLCFVLNNLKEYKYANVVLASILSNSTLKEYPRQNVGDVVFDITNDDLFNHEIAYFSYNDLSKTLIENLQNYHSKNQAEKRLIITLIKNKINSKLNFEEFTGKLINSYTKTRLENYIQETLSKMNNTCIEKHRINDIIYENVNQGEVNIIIYLSIKPYESIEDISIKVEV